MRPQQAVWGNKSRDQKDLYPPSHLQGKLYSLCLVRENMDPGKGEEVRSYPRSNSRDGEKGLPQWAQGRDSRQGGGSQIPA